MPIVLHAQVLWKVWRTSLLLFFPTQECLCRQRSLLQWYPVLDCIFRECLHCRRDRGPVKAETLEGLPLISCIAQTCVRRRECLFSFHSENLLSICLFSRRFFSS